MRFDDEDGFDVFVLFAWAILSVTVLYTFYNLLS